ncbi:MAG TPA: PaaI family thioesterase [Acidobacteria bacterium]|nr:PaaI family thioesterase [Acidobacteriota bacterium]
MSSSSYEPLIDLFESVPFMAFLGMRFETLEDGLSVLRIPFRPELIGNPELPALHGGVISALLDTCGGAAVWTRIGEHDRVSTVDLRVDYLRPGRPEDLLGRARVIRAGNRVAVTELRAYQPGAPDEPIAVGTGVYNIHRRGDRRRGGNGAG